MYNKKIEGGREGQKREKCPGGKRGGSGGFAPTLGKVQKKKTC